MVFLTMTKSMVDSLEKIQSPKPADNKDELREPDSQESKPRREDEPTAKSDQAEEKKDFIKLQDSKFLAETTEKASNKVEEQKGPTEPSLEDPKVGSPISHGQVIDLSRQLKAQGLSPYRLETLLKGAKVHVPPPPPKKEPTPEYKALMARLRREEELRAYERMTNPPTPMETFAQRFPASSAANAFAMNHEPPKAEEDELVYADIDRQMALIFNVLVSIIACAGAIWVVARWWSTPVRLALSMSGSALVGVAEVVVYSGYIRRVGEAKGQAKKLKEVKEVVKTWVVGGEDDEDRPSVPIESKGDEDSIKARRRKKDSA